MGCALLTAGHDIACQSFFNKYYQAIVLVNRKDVDETLVFNNDGRDTQISFNLKDGKTGYLFRSNENSGNLRASFSKSEDGDVPLYKHRVQLPIVGVSQETKRLLKELDLSDCFAAIRFKSGEIEIYGYNYGLKTSPYTYEPQGGIGGAVISLESRVEEYDPPYVYRGGANTRPTQEVLDQITIDDFCNLFANIDPVRIGDFNDDYNNDYFI